MRKTWPRAASRLRCDECGLVFMVRQLYRQPANCLLCSRAAPRETVLLACPASLGRSTPAAPRRLSARPMYQNGAGPVGARGRGRAGDARRCRHRPRREHARQQRPRDGPGRPGPPRVPKRRLRGRRLARRGPPSEWRLRLLHDGTLRRGPGRRAASSKSGGGGNVSSRSCATTFSWRRISSPTFGRLDPGDAAADCARVTDDAAFVVLPTVRGRVVAFSASSSRALSPLSKASNNERSSACSGSPVVVNGL